MASTVPLVKIKASPPRICQGDILRDIKYYDAVIDSEKEIRISEISFPYVMILTQDCDLEQESGRLSMPSSDDKSLLSILVAPMYNAQHLFAGKHLSELGWEMQVIDPKGTKGKLVQDNQIPRYHYLDIGAQGLVPLIIDFKHYFSLNVEYVKGLVASNFIGKVDALYRELISQRFAYFLSRIGLPSTVQTSKTRA